MHSVLGPHLGRIHDMLHQCQCVGKGLLRTVSFLDQSVTVFPEEVKNELGSVRNVEIVVWSHAIGEETPSCGKI